MADAYFEVNGKKYEIPEELTTGEMCDAENYFGVDFNDIKRSGFRLSAALLWVAMSRKDKTVTVDDVRSLPSDVFASLAEQLEKDADAGPPAIAEEKSESNGSGSDSSTTDSAGSETVPSLSGTLS